MTGARLFGKKISGPDCGPALKGARLFGILWRLQTRRLINRLQDLRTRSLTLTALGSALLILSLMGLLLIMDRSVQRLLDANAVREVIQRFVDVTWDPLRFTRYEDVPDQGARLMLLFLNSTLLSALFLKWGHWQSLQRDEEWEWFAEQPCPAWALFVQRCWMESLWPQGFSLFIGAFFMLLGLQRGWAPLSALGMTLVLVLTLQTLLAAPRLTLDLWLRLRWPAHRVRTLRGAFGLIGAALLVLGLQALSIDQGWAVIAVMRMSSILDATPVALALSAVMLRDEAAALRHFASLLGIVVVIHLACYGWAAWALRRPTPGHAAWLGRSQDQKKQTLGLRTWLWNRLHPLTRRDLTLLTRDRHFILQILGAPLVFAIVPQGLPMQDTAWLLAMAWGTGLLFLWSAVFYILPMEGRSLWLLFTWPQTLSQFLRRRLMVLLALAGCYAGLVLGLGFLRAGWERPWELWRLLYISWGMLDFGVLFTSLAVFTYEPEAQGREQRPGLWLNYGMLILGAFYGWFLFRPDARESLLVMVGLSALAGFLWWRMTLVLPALLDRHAAPPVRKLRGQEKLHFFKFITRWIGFACVKCCWFAWIIWAI